MFHSPYAYKKPVKKVAVPSVVYNSDDVWAAAWQAYVQNGNQYQKIANLSAGEKTNRMIAEELLSDTTKITQESREIGIEVRRYFQGLAFKVIEGKGLSPFLQGAHEASCKEEITSKFDLAVIISLPATYEKSTKRDDVDRRINFAHGGYVGTIGDKVTANIEVVKRVWSQNWNTWYITGITDQDQVLFFAHKKEMEIGSCVTIQGTVKGTRDKSTQLNRVKVI